MEVVVDSRRDELLAWLKGMPEFAGGQLTVASADASFRRYFRWTIHGQSYVVMDAPPEKEPCESFVKIAKLLLQAGVRVPEIFAQDLERGFLVLSDFGDLHYQEAIEGKGRDNFYELALGEILKLQTGLREEAKTLPDYDEEWVRMELEIFREWCLPELPQEKYEKVTTLLVESFLEQPRIFVHRDFHCRNLLVLSDGNPGVIDFQGALHGPITYDPVSLLRDCYVDNDENWIASKALGHKSRLVESGILPSKLSDEAFLRWFDFTGLQRHLKCIGIFHRLKLRDGKGSYLADVPRVLGYSKTVLSRWPELEPLHSIVDQAQILS
tara:strand:+ start:47 stop:1021 length:975 start_codon:yes stop_codon:yes gene_type:complete